MIMINEPNIVVCVTGMGPQSTKYTIDHNHAKTNECLIRTKFVSICGFCCIKSWLNNGVTNSIQFKTHVNT